MSTRSVRRHPGRRVAAGGTVVRFLLVGSLNTAVDVVIYTLLVAAGTPVVPANLVSTTCGLIVSFLLNRSFVFRAGGAASAGSRVRQVLLFLLVTGFGLWVLQPLLILAVTGLLRPVAMPQLAAVLLPKLAATAVTLVWNYSFYSLLVFARAKVVAHAGPEGPAAVTTSPR